ncbi:disks large-like protein [Lasius niger]|uniref:Disks large-like protein n=1 Tax=Lasius niger TaxID=67767 RepID=A0A0J7L9I7_LASNI|nr:disks large-like protein [Lasius niger]
MCTEARRRRDRLRKKKKKTTMKKRKKKHSYSVCPGGTERVASVFVGNEGKGRKRKGGHPSRPDGHPRRWWLCCRRARRWDGFEAVLS